MSTSPQATLVDLREALDAYRTCEFATLTKNVTPIAWPTVPQVAADGSSILLTTSVGLPQKAFNVRRDPRVALLFSDATGSGRSDLPQVLVQGTAACPDVIQTSPAGLEDYWARMAKRQPSSKSNSSSAVSRRLMDWYYMRLVITVTPETVTVRPPLQEAGSLTAPAVERRDHSPFAEVVRRLPTYRSAVLGVQRGDGLPSLRRVQLAVDAGARAFRLEDPSEEPLSAGPASLLLHRHNEHLWDLHNFVVMGELTQHDDGWVFVPRRFVPGTDGLNPVAVVRAVRQMRRSADGYLSRRHLDRPQIAWDEFKRVTASATWPSRRALTGLPHAATSRA
jgi:Pyridoxamine 5'-phosphate oxidase